MLRKFISYYKPYKGLFILDMTCAFFIAAIELVYPLISRYALNTLLPAEAFRAFYVWMIILTASYVLKAVLQFIVSYWGHLLGNSMEIDMRRDLFAHLQTLSFRFYDTHRTGHLMSRLVSDLFEVVELAHHGPEDLFISGLTLVGATVVMFVMRWQLALVIAVLAPVLVGFTILRRTHMGRAGRQMKEKIGVINTAVESSISGVRAAQAFRNEPHEMRKFTAGSEEYRTARCEFYKQMAIFGAGSDFITNLMNIAVIAVGGALIAAGRMEYLDLLVFMMYVSSFLTPIRKLANFVEQYTTGMAGFVRFQELMAEQPDIAERPDAKDLVCDGGHIRLDGVKFHYYEGVPVLKGVTLDIPAGRTTALVGPSGGGKSTLCHMIPRFYDVTDGAITVDGQDVRTVTLASLRQQVGIVQQEVVIYADTVRENIRYGRLDATDAEVEEAARLAELHDTILEMPDGYDTVVGERGITLSGGQKQRISIARIFLKNPAILLLDEATSALDTVTEAHIQKAFEKLSEGRTTVVIAHRLSTVRNADQIVYLDKEGVREIGTHEELLARGGFYAKLFEATQRLG